MAVRAAAETLIAMHLVHTIRPWHRRFEKAFDRQLLSRADRKAGYYTWFIDGGIDPMSARTTGGATRGLQLY
jgi:hypothetical protein